MGFTKWIKNEVKVFKSLIKDISYLALLTFVVTFFVQKSQVPTTTTQNFFSVLNLGFAYLLIIFLFVMILVHIYLKFPKSPELHDISFRSVLNYLKSFNYLILVFFSLIFAFFFTFIFEQIIRFPAQIMTATGVFIASWLALIIQLASIVMPIILMRTLGEIVKSQRKKSTQWLIVLITFSLTGVAIPLIAFLIRKVWTDLFFLPVFFFTAAGWAFLIAFIRFQMKSNS